MSAVPQRCSRCGRACVRARACVRVRVRARAHRPLARPPDSCSAPQSWAAHSLSTRASVQVIQEMLEPTLCCEPAFPHAERGKRHEGPRLGPLDGLPDGRAARRVVRRLRGLGPSLLSAAGSPLASNRGRIHAAPVASGPGLARLHCGTRDRPFWRGCIVSRRVGGRDGHGRVGPCLSAVRPSSGHLTAPAREALGFGGESWTLARRQGNAEDSNGVAGTRRQRAEQPSVGVSSQTPLPPDGFRLHGAGGRRASAFEEPA